MPDRGIIILLSLIWSSLSICAALVVRPISEAHRSAALELFVPVNGSFGSLEDIYEAFRTFEILGIQKTHDVSDAACKPVVDKLGSPSSTAKDLFYALKVNSILRCHADTIKFEEIASKLQAVLKSISSLPDFYYSIGSLLLIKNQGFEVLLSDATGAFQSIKALSQSDGRWRYISHSAESSTYAAGMALEALAGVVSIADSEVDKSMIAVVKNDIVKLFDSLKRYNDGTWYFDDKYVHMNDYRSPLEISASVIRGVTAFAEVASGRVNIPGNKILGLAKLFLSLGVPGTSKDLFLQIEALSCLENNRIYIPLIISLPATILSLTLKDQLKVHVTSLFGAPSPLLTMKLMQALNSNSDGKPNIENQELYFDKENSIHSLDIASLKVDIGEYKLIFEASFLDHEDDKKYATEGRTSFSVFFTGSIQIDKAELAILNSDGDSIETIESLDLSKDSPLSLSANHLQKFRLSFQLTTPLGRSFKPHQVFLKLRHGTKVEHIFLIESSARQYNLTLDFLGLVEILYYLSGKYDIELAVGDTVMENSFLRTLAFVELDLPEPPEKAPQAPLQPIDSCLRYSPKEEINHIFRSPEKRPPKQLSSAFFALTCLPLLGFLIGLVRLRVNLKLFPSTPGPAAFSLLFHAGVASVLLLYGLFWLKLDLFTTLKILSILGIFLVFVGHRTLSCLAVTSAKLKLS